MADDDIYGSRRSYERLLQRLTGGEALETKYPCHNKANLRYFGTLADLFEVRDLSYVRRLRLFRSFQIVTHFIDQDLGHIKDRGEINHLVVAVRRLPLSTRTQADFITDLKHMWKLLFPDHDAQGRPDETTTPYVVRHLSGHVDKSREKRRGDRLTLDEFERLLISFNDDARLQAYLTLAVESLARPQELLYLRIKDVELHDTYAVIFVSEHGKEGTKLLRCIDSYSYVAQWYTRHPRRNDPEAYFFCNLGRTNRYGQMSTHNVNSHIRKHLQREGINKPVTSYSLKRNGVTLRVLRGESPIDIQKVAGWTSPKQLQTYDQSDQQDAYRQELIQRGLITGEGREAQRISKTCTFCNTISGFGDAICRNCRRPLDRETLLKKEQKELERLTEHVVEAKVAELMARFGVGPRNHETGPAGSDAPAPRGRGRPPIV